jgi:hypothetical protein
LSKIVPYHSFNLGFFYQAGYPKSDEQLYDFFATKFTDFEVAYDQILSFFIVLFRHVAKIFEKYPDLADAAAWRTWLEKESDTPPKTNRDIMYDEIRTRLAPEVRWNLVRGPRYC